VKFSVQNSKNKIQQACPVIQTGLDRYIHVKRRHSPQNTAVGNKSKISRAQFTIKYPNALVNKIVALTGGGKQNISELYPNIWRKLRKTTVCTS